MANIKRANTSGITKSGVAIPDVPDAPTIGAATDVGTSRAFNNGAATVAITSAAATGGTPTSYTVTSSPGGFTATGTSPVTVTGLSSNTAYTFTAQGVNSTATGPASTASNSITATTVPATMTAPTASDSGSGRAYNNGAASVSFSAPATGGKAITGYTVTSSPGSFTGTGSSSPITVTGQQSATAYTYTVTATNANGTSTASPASGSVTATTVPQAPTIGTVSRTNDTTVSIPFTAGATGGSAITSYTTTSSPSISLSTSGTTTPLTVTGTFATSQAYTFTIAAVNANGTSSSSGSSNSVTPKQGQFIGYTTQPDRANGVYVNSDGIYIVGRTNTGINTAATIARLNRDGTFNWQRTLDVSGQQDMALGVYGDTSGNIYVIGEWYKGSTETWSAFIAQYSSTGTLNYQKDLAITSSAYDKFSDIVIDSSNNIYLAGVYNKTSSYYPLIIKSNTTPTFTWAKEDPSALPSSYSVEYMRIALGTSGNVHTLVPYTNNPGKLQNSAYFVSILDTNGARVRIITSAGGIGNNRIARGLAVDSGNNIYVGGGVSNGGSDNFGLTKYNSSGTHQWTRSFPTGVYNDICVDSSDNIYAVGYVNVSPSSLFIAKFNSSGTLQWQRTITTSTGIKAEKAFYDSANNKVAVTGSIGNNHFISYVPSDGSGTGTYTVGSYSIVYATSSYTDSAFTPTTTTGTPANITNVTTSLGNSSMTGATSAYTAYAATI